MASETTPPASAPERPARFSDFMNALYRPEIGLIDQHGPKAFSKGEWASWVVARPLLDAPQPEWEALPLDKVARHRLKTRIAALLDELDIDKQQLRLEALLARSDYPTHYAEILAAARPLLARPLTLRDPRTLQALMWKLRIAAMNHAEKKVFREITQFTLELTAALKAQDNAEQKLCEFWLNPWEAETEPIEELLRRPDLAAGMRFELGRMLMVHYYPRRMQTESLRIAEYLYAGICSGEFYSTDNQTRVVKYLMYIRFELFEDTTDLMADVVKDTTGQLFHYRLNQILSSLSLRRFEGIAEALAATEPQTHEREEFYLMHKLIRTEYYILTRNLLAAENLNNVLYLNKADPFFKSTGDKLINQRLRIFLLNKRYEETIALFHRKSSQKMMEPMLKTNRYYFVPHFCLLIAEAHTTPDAHTEKVEEMLQKLESLITEVFFSCYRNVVEAAELMEECLTLAPPHAKRLAAVLATVRAKLNSVAPFLVYGR